LLPEGLLGLVEDIEARQPHIGQVALAETVQFEPRLNALLPFGK
jgi:hypothetical protein